jgi:hypothetical protein
LLADDSDGSGTRDALKAVKRIAERIAGNHPSSLGLHPAVYFYSASGRYQPTAFLSTAALVQELDQRNGLIGFTEARSKFEDFLLKYRYFVNQVVVHYGSGSSRGLGPLSRLHSLILAGVRQGDTESKIVADLQTEAAFPFLKVTPDERPQSSRSFSAETKSEVFLREAINSAARCAICGARVHSKSISVDHKIRRQDGGTGSSANAQLAHPFCNTGYKEWKHAQSKRAGQHAAPGP